MAGTTSIFGWPYPLPTDKLADGATVLGNFINDLEDQLAISLNTYDADEPYTSYPLGYSSMTTSGDFGWPYTAGHVISFRVAGGFHVTQFFVWRTTVLERRAIYVRYGYDDGGAHWSGWRVFGSSGSPTAEASGQISGTPPSGGGVVALNVTFPAERFATAPRVMVCANATTLPQQIACSVSNLTNAGCTIYLYRTGATNTSVAWHAILGVD